MNAKEKERAEAQKSLREYLLNCGPDGMATMLITWAGGGATPYGRTDYLDVHTIETDYTARNEMRCVKPRVTGWLSRLIVRAGYGQRFNEKREAISVGGCGFNKAHDVASFCARIAGHPVYCEGQYTGWVGK